VRSIAWCGARLSTASDVVTDGYAVLGSTRHYAGLAVRGWLRAGSVRSRATGERGDVAVLGRTGLLAAALLCGPGFADLKGNIKITGGNRSAIFCWKGAPTSGGFALTSSDNMGMKGSGMHLAAARVIVPNNAPNGYYKTISALPSGIRSLFDFRNMNVSLIRKYDVLVWKYDSLPYYLVGSKLRPTVGDVRIIKARSGTPRVNIGIWPSRICWQGTRIPQLKFEGQGNCTHSNTNWPSDSYGHPYPSALDGRVKVVLTGHESGLPFGNGSLQLADTDLTFSKPSLSARNEDQKDRSDDRSNRRSGLNPGGPIKALSVVGIASSWVGAWIGGGGQRPKLSIVMIPGGFLTLCGSAWLAVCGG